MDAARTVTSGNSVESRVEVTCPVEECAYNFNGRCIAPKIRLRGKTPKRLECDSYVPAWVW